MQLQCPIFIGPPAGVDPQQASATLKSPSASGMPRQVRTRHWTGQDGTGRDRPVGSRAARGFLVSSRRANIQCPKSITLCSGSSSIQTLLKKPEVPLESLFAALTNVKNPRATGDHRPAHQERQQEPPLASGLPPFTSKQSVNGSGWNGESMGHEVPSLDKPKAKENP
ncbi:hypothetical protein CPLU01_09144 [Colletotrichum plurivorum]|uniref:Uncharacterized protein n=1 Tax=Colletotrichum plurivorum TaxID=2175906 RepID=A0A8H6NC26_9PEZI|nr:hypothetical protein CPLU01_09144 [Colletotrichum plurivorum]